jgi:hypothetical protein
MQNLVLRICGLGGAGVVADQVNWGCVRIMCVCACHRIDAKGGISGPAE